MFMQHRIEIGFGNPQSPFRTIWRARIRIPVGGMVEAGDLIAVHARYEEIVAWIIGWVTGLISHSVDKTPAAHMFTGPGVCKVGGWKIHSAVALLDDEALDSAPS